MSRRERINRFFNKVNQEYFIGKSHLMTCETTDQVNTVCSWMANLNDKWDNELELIVKNDGLQERKNVVDKYNNINAILAEEWNSLVSTKAQELNIEEPKYEPVYRAPVVVRGFDDNYKD